MLTAWSKRTPWNTDPALNRAAMEWGKRNNPVAPGMTFHPHAVRDSSEDVACCLDEDFTDVEWAAHRATVEHLVLLCGVSADQSPDRLLPAMGNRYAGVASLARGGRPNDDAWEWAAALVIRGAAVPDVRLYLSAGMTLAQVLAMYEGGPTEEALDEVLVMAALRAPWLGVEVTP